MIRIIAAIDEQRGLAKGDVIPWKIPSDIKRFRELTLTHGGSVLVGRSTYALMSNYFNDHKTFVVSRSELQLPAGQVLVNDIDEFLNNYKEDIWVIGGAGIYEATIKYADELYLTVVEGKYDCDKFFPIYEKFKLQNTDGPYTDNGFTFSYQLLTRF